MTTLGIISDLHTEFWDKPFSEWIIPKIRETIGAADLILLAGDIGSGAHAVHYATNIFPDKPVCLVAGNHEFYGKIYDPTIAAIETAAQNTNVNFLNRSTYFAQDVRVLGVTLWTDFNLYGTQPLSLFHGRQLQDYRYIRRYPNKSLIPQDTVEMYEKDKNWLLEEIKKPFDGKTVIMTHHCPVSFGIAPRFKMDDLSPCFASRLFDYLPEDKIDVIVWGHTHYSMNMHIDKTHFISSQIGYANRLLNSAELYEIEGEEFGYLLRL